MEGISKMPWIWDIERNKAANAASNHSYQVYSAQTEPNRKAKNSRWFRKSMGVFIDNKNQKIL